MTTHLDTPLRRSPLHDRHTSAGARMAPFAGWEMPIHYGSVVAEHMAVRDRVGMFDLTHLGTVMVAGVAAADVVQRAFTNDATTLDVGRSQYSLCLDEQAGILDDLLVYRLRGFHLVVPNAANTGVVTGRLLDVARSLAPDGRTSVDVVDLACVAVQGPRSVAALTDALAELRLPGDPGDLAYLDCIDLPDGGVLSRSGYTGEVGFEVFVAGEVAGRLWDVLAADGVTLAGLGCRDTLRLEMGYPLHGNDISADTTPVEALLGWAVKPGTGFVGEAAYVAAAEAGPRRKLRGLVAEGRRAPRAGDAVLLDGNPVGTMTSGSYSPVLERAVGMAHLDAEVELGTAVAVDVRGRPVAAEVARPPFVAANPREEGSGHE